MKTRVISGIVLIVIVAGILAAGSYFPVIITAFLAIMNIIASYEMLHNVAGIKSRWVLAGVGIFSGLAVFSLGGYNISVSGHESSFAVLCVFYAIFAAAACLAEHKSFSISSISTLIGMPIIISYAFGGLEGTLNDGSRIYYLLLLLNFSSICDMGAYFVGVTLGKHKLCPEISPKKTIEGAVGGIVSSIIVTIALVFGFKGGEGLLSTLLLTVPFCLLGIIGDLFASCIKRSVGIKDYGSLIPGHGGVLDRMDSILMIAPLLHICIESGLL